MVIIYLRSITLRPILSDSLPFSTFKSFLFPFLFILFPNLEGFRQDGKKFIKIFLIHRFSNPPICQLKLYRVYSIEYRVKKEKEKIEKSLCYLRGGSAGGDGFTLVLRMTCERVLMEVKKQHQLFPVVL